MSKFNDDVVANNEFGNELLSVLTEQGFELSNVVKEPVRITDEYASIVLNTQTVLRVRSSVLSFLRNNGYTKRISRSSGTVYYSTEDNSKRVFYSVHLSPSYYPNSMNNEMETWVHLSFQTLEDKDR